MNTKSPDVENRSDNSSADRASSLDKMKAILVARLKAKPGNAEAWREFAQVKRMMGDIDLFCLMEDFDPGTVDFRSTMPMRLCGRCAIPRRRRMDLTIDMTTNDLQSESADTSNEKNDNNSGRPSVGDGCERRV